MATAKLRRTRQRGTELNLDYSRVARWVQADVNRYAPRQSRFEEEQDFAELADLVARRGGTAFSRGESEDTIGPADLPGGRTPGAEAVVLATPRLIIDKTARILGRAKKSIEYVPADPSMGEVGQVIENLLRWIDREHSQRWVMGMHAPMQYELGHYAALRGWLCSRVTLNPDRNDNLPVLRSIHDAANVYPYEVGGRLVRVTEQYRASVSDLLSDPTMADGEEWLTTLDDEYAAITVSSVYVEVADKHGTPRYYHAILGEPGRSGTEEDRWLKRPVEIGYMPWVITLVQGAPYRGTPWDSQNSFMEWMGTGVLTPLARNFRYRNKLASMLMTVLANSANPPKVVFTDDDQQAAEQLKKGFRAGDTIILRQGDKLSLERIGPAPGDFQAMNNLLEEIEYKGSLHSTMWGDPTGVTSGFQAAIVKGNALDYLFPLVEAMRMHETLVLRRCLELIADHWPEQMRVTLPAAAHRPAQTAELDPILIRAAGFAGITVEFDDVTPQDFATAAQVWTMLVREGLASLKRARGREGLKFDDPELENQEVLGDLIFKDEQVVKFLVPFALELTGRKLAQQLYGQLHGSELLGLLAAAVQNAGLGQQAPPQGAPQPPPGLLPGEVAPPVAQTGIPPGSFGVAPEVMPATVAGGIGGGGIPPAGGEAPLLPGPLIPGV